MRQLARYTLFVYVPLGLFLGGLFQAVYEVIQP